MQKRFIGATVATTATAAVLVVLPAPWMHALQLPRDQWGAPAVTVAKRDKEWVITGRRTNVAIGASDLAVRIDADSARWSMAHSSPRELVVRRRGEEFPLRIADAERITITPYDTGFKTGVKITASNWRHQGDVVDLTLVMTLALEAVAEGNAEDLVFDIAAKESEAGETVVRQVDWPGTVDAGGVDYTVLNHYRGILLPRNWATDFHPIRPGPQANDTSEIQSNVIESWSMPWWGFQKGVSAMMVIIETPDDAAYQFSHPAGGPTVIGPRWRATLGRFGYPRAGRLVFFAKGNYVDLAKRYRRHAIETGLFVSLKAKMARSPKVASLVATPLTRLSILRNVKPDSTRYDANAPEKNRTLTTYDERARQLRELKAKGIDQFHVVLTGWPHLGYDRQHPDGLPPSPDAGGWAGAKRFADTVRELGYLLTLHDQYRDYYVDAPSYNPQFAIHEEDEAGPPQAFPGTRFGIWKEGRIPFMKHWDGGKQTFLNSRFMLGHLRKNYRLLFDHGIRPDGSYLDVFGYVPPDEDFNAEHPTTRSQAMRDRAACYTWVREHLGLVGTEAAVDWVVPYVDYSSPLRPGRAGIPIPLFNLVYHDAIITPYAPGDLHGFLNGGLPQVGFADFEKLTDRIREMAALHKRVALLELTKHEFLDANHRRERTTFADGTTVTVDWDKNTVVITP